MAETKVTINGETNGGGAWQSWTPTFSNSNGTLTMNVTYAKYMVIGKTVFWRIMCNTTAVSTPGGLYFTPPVAPIHVTQWTGSGREDAATGKMFEILFKGSSTAMNVMFYDNTGSTCTNGYLYIMGGSYEGV